MRRVRKSVKATGAFACGHVGTLYLSGTVQTCHRRWVEVLTEECNACFAASLPTAKIRNQFMAKLAASRQEHLKWREANPERCETWDDRPASLKELESEEQG
jgi:hypothetical protein